MNTPLRNDWLGNMLNQLPKHARKVLADEAPKVESPDHWANRLLRKKRPLAAKGVSYA